MGWNSLYFSIKRRLQFVLHHKLTMNTDWLWIKVAFSITISWAITSRFTIDLREIWCRCTVKSGSLILREFEDICALFFMSKSLTEKCLSVRLFLPYLNFGDRNFLHKASKEGVIWTRTTFTPSFESSDLSNSSHRAHSTLASCVFLLYMPNIWYTVVPAPGAVESNMKISYSTNRFNWHSNSGTGTISGFHFLSPRSICKYKNMSSAHSKDPSSLY